jgi:hypothetical protein
MFPQFLKRNEAIIQWYATDNILIFQFYISGQLEYWPRTQSVDPAKN